MDRYFIPQNFATEGVVFGSIRLRNLIEGVCILLAIGYPIFFKTHFSVTAKIEIGILIMAPLEVLAIKGINGLSLTSFLFDFFETIKNKKIYCEPTNKDRIRRGKNLMLKRFKQTQQTKKETKIQKKQERLDKKDRKQAQKRRKERH